MKSKNQILIKKEWVWCLVEIVVNRLEVDIVEKARSKNKEVVRVVEEMKKAWVKVLRDDK